MASDSQSNSQEYSYSNADNIISSSETDTDEYVPSENQSDSDECIYSDDENVTVHKLGKNILSDTQSDSDECIYLDAEHANVHKLSKSVLSENQSNSKQYTVKDVEMEAKLSTRDDKEENGSTTQSGSESDDVNYFSAEEDFPDTESSQDSYAGILTLKHYNEEYSNTTLGNKEKKKHTSSEEKELQRKLITNIS